MGIKLVTEMIGVHIFGAMTCKPTETFPILV